MYIYTINLEATSSIEMEYEIEIFPNPTSGLVTINIPQESTLKIFNVIGDLIDQINLKNDINNVDISEFSDGIYYFEIYKDKLIFTKKIIKNTK